MSLSKCRNLEGIEEKSKKRKRSGNHGLEWKLWLLSNYEYQENALTFKSSIINESQIEKENIGNADSLLSSVLLGRLVKEIWKERVRSVQTKKGKKKREKAFVNLVRKGTSQGSGEEINLSRIELPERWARVKNGSTVSFIRYENWELNGQRVVTEIVVESTGEKYKLSLKCHGNYFPEEELHLGPNTDVATRVKCLINFVERSSHCKGYVCCESVAVTVPCLVSQFKEVPDGVVEKRAFSSNCRIFFVNGDRCRPCAFLLKRDSKRRREKGDRKFVSPYCNNRWLSKKELTEKSKIQQKKIENGKNREKFWRKKFDEQSITLDEADHGDLNKIFDNTNKDECVPEHMQNLWEQQQKILRTKSSRGYRWHPRIMQLCLDLYCKNPRVLDPMRKLLFLPSNRTIRLHKNKITQSSGWNREVLKWCLEEAREKKLTKADYCGGLVIDEMKIQENLEMTFKNGKHRLVGFVDLGPCHESTSTLSGNTELKLATHVLQFVFLSDSGFRFPVAQYPSAECTPNDLFFVFWEGVLKMKENGFLIYWTILDGAETNRQFIKLHFKKTEPAEANFTAKNYYTGGPMVFIVDCKHNIKKIRNNIEKSSDKEGQGTRCLLIDGHKILWEDFKKCYEWDQESHSLPIHEKLTHSHFQLDPASKMRNFLAEDVLNKRMLELMEHFKEDLLSRRHDRDLEGPIMLLQHTSLVIELFQSKVPIYDTTDKRLKALEDFYSFLKKWKASTKKCNFLSPKLWFDLQSMIMGIQSLVSIKLKMFPGSILKPAIINQDVVENHFGQVRSYNGQNNNPSYLQQESTQNTVRHGQNSVSSKCNAGSGISS